MIRNTKVLNFAEVKNLLEKAQKQEKKEKEENEIVEKTLAYVKKFGKLNLEKSKELWKELEKLDIIKLRERQISKIIDLLPADASELHNLFVGDDIVLDQNETQKILSTVQKYK